MGSQETILVVGATGYIGRHLAKASARLGHKTVGLVQPATLSDPCDADIVHSLKQAGVTIVQGDLYDQQSLIEALRGVDVVISAVGGAQLKDQINLIEAIKQVGHIKRFLPSEYGSDTHKSHTLPPIQAYFAAKDYIKDQVKTAGIPYTVVVSNTFANYYLRNLSQLNLQSPPTERALIWGHGEAYFVDEDDIGTYAVKAAVDPRAENKVLHIRPSRNRYTHKEVVELWEKISGQHLVKTQLEEHDVLKKVEETTVPGNIALAFFYSILVKGDQTHFEVPPDEVEATALYPDVQYTTIDEYFYRLVCEVA